MSKVHSKVMVQSVGGLVWLSGAASAIWWMLHGGGLIRPAMTFSIAVACFVLALLWQGSDVGGRTLINAVKCGAASGMALLLTALFMEFWWVTVSVACMFAIGRGFREEDTPVYG